MSARFAGSQRLGDRRRRRLAVESDEVAEADSRIASPAPAGAVRAIDGAHSHLVTNAAPSKTQLSRLIPFEWWKYLIIAIGLLAIAGGLLFAGWKGAELSPAVGPGFERMFAFPDAPATRWFAGVLLFVSAELALFIWWARSQSQNDFDGRYWLWIRVACVWLAYSGCLATRAHDALRDTLLHFRPDFSAGMLLLGWLAPLALGISVIAGLAREMRDCRSSRALLFLSAVAYVCAAATSFEFESVLPPAGRPLVIQGLLLGGHIGLILSMWWHARHVVYRTADPAMQAKSTWRIPRPHFRLLHFRLPQFGRKPRDAAAPKENAHTTTRRQRTAKVATDIPQRPAEPAEVRATPRPAADSASKPQFRFDARHENSPVKTEHASGSPATEIPAQRATVGASAGSGSPRENNVTAVQSPARINLDPVRAQSDSSELNSDNDESEEQSSKPDMRGLSKKQRRRLMQELRDRERASGR